MEHLEREQRPISIGDANGLGLCTIIPLIAKEPNVDARGWQTFVAKDTRAI